jgi:hypothetical protein
MFRWYQGAKKCYVCLSDVSTRERKRDESSQNNWEQAFQTSEWFTRGWTLQELLAPVSVEFFSKEGNQLGNKRSLERQIHEITSIPTSALRSSILSRFSNDQKFHWAQNRQTTREEDWAYSLLGIFEVSMPVIYGEGRAKAVKRLIKEIDDTSKYGECIRDLYITDPRDDKTRIEETKGGLLEGSYNWILDHRDYRQWRYEQQNHLLWIKGDPGKGKTMLLCGIVNELNRSMAKSDLLFYFFCQATDSRINNATAVQRGLLELVHDARRFIMYHKPAIENSPLQAYTSALMFSPTRSMIKSLFKHDEPKNITLKPAMRGEWSPCLQTLEGHSSSVYSVAFSHDSTRLASGSGDRTVKIWDASNGKCLQSLNVGVTVDKISFDITGSYIHTKIGAFVVDTSSASYLPLDSIQCQYPRCEGVGLSSNRAWITGNLKNSLWLPAEYRPSCSSVSGTKIAIGVGNGKVYIYHVQDGQL